MIEQHEPYADHAPDHHASFEAALPTLDAAAEQVGVNGFADPMPPEFGNALGDAATALPGGLRLTDPGGSMIDIGEPTLASTGETPDSVVSYTARGAEVYSDLDGDGRVDQIVRVDLGGQVTAWTLGGPDAENGNWQLTSTGSIDPFGGIALSEPGTEPADDPASPMPPSATTPSAAEPSAAEPSAAEPSAAEPSAAEPSATEPSATEPSAAEPSAAEPSAAQPAHVTDGVLDTVVVRSADGSVTHASDLDGDGLADRLTVVAADGHVTVSRSDEDGHWEVVSTDAGDRAQPAGAGHGAVPDDHIAVLDHGRYIDAGAPQYDMNGDGAPETAVVERAGVILQYSDTDGDGRADQLLTVNADHSASISLVSGGGWEVAVQGRIAGDGDFVPTEHVAQAGQHAEPSEPTSPPSHRPPGQHAGAPDIELRAPGVDAVDLGRPNQDLDGDGVPESVAVRTQDGHVLIVSDTDADGAADQLIDIDPDTGHAQWMAQDAHGQWAQTQHGHVDGSGALVVDETGKASGAELPSGMTGEEQLTVSVGGRHVAAGPATIDSDGDGVADTVSVPGVGGSTQYYQDADGDGVADRAWTVNPDGTRSGEYTIDASGQWVRAPSWEDVGWSAGGSGVTDDS